MLSEKRKHEIEAGGAILVLLLLFWWLLRSSSAAAPQTLNTNDPTGQSAQPNNFQPAQFDVPPFEVNVKKLNFPLVYQSGGNFPLYLDIPETVFKLNVAADDCDCGTGNNCPVSPYTVGTINKMRELGVAYANAMIDAANNTQQAILQNFANAGQNVYFVNNGIGQ